MLRELFHYAIPPSFYGGETAFPVLSEVRRRLRDSGDPGAVLTQSRAELFAKLRRRFSEPEAQALTLKALNVILAQHHLAARSSKLASRPIGLVVDPSNACQLGCPGCVHSARAEALQTFDWSNGTLSEDRFAALLRRFGPHAVAVYFCDYGEPLLNLRTPELIRAAKRYLLGTALSTSLSVKRFDPEAYVASGLDFMVLSIDGVTQEVYERFRRNGDLDLALANLRKLVETKRKMHKRTPTLSWNFLAFEHNAHEIPDAMHLARRLGVDQFRVVRPFDVTWDDPSIRPADVKPSVRHLDWASASNRPENWNPFPGELDAESVGGAFASPWGDISDIVEPAAPGHACQWLYRNMAMDANGRILPCCGPPARDRDLVFAMFDGNGADPFNSPKYQSARAHFAHKTDTGVHCAQCDWDQSTVSIGGEEVARYFRAADPAFFDRASRRLLAE
jgi:MoaA/NifB/PqqE/SkfB family radical SAM enzyme